MSSAACEAAPGGQVRLRLVLRDRLAQVEFGANPTIASPLPSPARCHPSAWLGAPTGVPFGVKFAHDHPPSASTSPTCAPWNRLPLIQNRATTEFTNVTMIVPTCW